MITADLELVFSLWLAHLKNSKNLKNVHIKGIDNESAIKYNYDKLGVIKIWRYGMWFWKHVSWNLKSHLFHLLAL